MAAANAHDDDELEYESDLEDTPLPSLRRRDASDDEDGGGSGDGERSSGNKVLRDEDVGPDGDSDGQGAAQVYDDDEEFDEEEYYVEEEEYGNVRDVAENVDGQLSGAGEGDGGELSQSLEADGGLVEVSVASEEGKDNGEEEGVEKKENEPSAVPTSGTFYMHDDRFQENGRGRRRRMFGSQKLWDNKDEHAWLHDRFEEMNVQDSQYSEEKRKSKGQYRGRGGRGRTYASGRPRSYNEGVDNQNRAPRAVRGRGPSRYESHFKNYRENKSVQQRQLPVKSSQQTARNSGAEKPSSQITGVQKDHVLPQKNSFSSSLNYASPPFYPSSSSGQDIPDKRHDKYIGIENKGLQNSMQLKATLETSNSSSLLRATAVIDATKQNKFFSNDPIKNVASKPMHNFNMQSSEFSSPSGNVGHPRSSRSQGRGLNTNATPSTQSSTAVNQVGRVSSQSHSSSIHQRPVQPPNLSAVRVSTKQLVQHPGSGNQTSPPPLRPLESDSPPGSSPSKTSLVAKGKVNEGAGRGSFLYGGAQVIGAAGAMGLPHGDENFPGTPALLPVMQFGGQHPSGLGVPAMGMALPGYVAQPQLGFGNSEMTWMPVLAGAAGALGGQYCPPYIALDSSFYANPGQTQSSSSSRETGTNKSDGSMKSNQRPEIVNDELGQRQNKPRRYSEMSFGQ